MIVRPGAVAEAAKRSGLGPRSRLFCALDLDDLELAVGLAGQLADEVGGFKLGIDFFLRHGPDGVARVAGQMGELPLFLDLKLNEIPTTMGRAIGAVMHLKPAFLTLHGGSPNMMRGAVAAAREHGHKHGHRPSLLVVTMLTSLEATHTPVQATAMLEQVTRLGSISKQSGFDGILCAPHEVATLRGRMGPDFVLMVPGIRPAWAGRDDHQAPVMAPAEAIASGADFLVVGRPITAAENPVEAARRLVRELSPSG